MQYKFLLHPLNTNQISQSFGQNLACIDKATGTKTIYCDGLNPPAGYRSVYQGKGHTGLDFPCYTGQPIYATHDGIVTEYVAENERGLGLGITSNTKHYFTETNSKEYFKTRYWHNLVNLVKLGDEVRVGQIIALADNTGYSSGDHLHFELKPVEIFLRTDGSIRRTTNLLQDNGFFGSVDPAPYLSTAKASLLTKAKTKADRWLVWLKLALNRL